MPPYVIFHDSVLREMAAQRPASRAALAHLSGIGARKLEAYGDAFLDVISIARLTAAGLKNTPQNRRNRDQNS